MGLYSYIMLCHTKICVDVERKDIEVTQKKDKIDNHASLKIDEQMYLIFVKVLS